MFKSITDTMHDFKLSRDKYNPWSETMDLFFAVASELYHRGDDIPASWGYSPGLSSDPREPDSTWFELVSNETSEDLTAMGNLLHRHCRYLVFKGRDY